MESILQCEASATQQFCNDSDQFIKAAENEVGSKFLAVFTKKQTKVLADPDLVDSKTLLPKRSLPAAASR